MSQELKVETPAQPLTPTAAPPDRMSYEEFLASTEGTWAEWVDGEVIVLSPASTKHQQLMRFLLALFSHFTEAGDLGEVLAPPFQMKLSTRPSGREPDLIFIAKKHLDRLKNTYLDGPADLVIEIVSPESQARDRGEKFYEYEAAGVPEYWLLDQPRLQAEFYELGEDRRYKRIEISDNGVFRSKVIEGPWLKVDWLWQDPLPTLMSVLKEWKLVN